MSKQQLMTVKELELIFDANGSRHLDKTGVNIEYAGEVRADINLWNGSPTDFTLYIEQLPEEFIRDFKISSEADLIAIDAEELWSQYGKGNGCLWASLDLDTDLNLSFQVIDGVTVVEGHQIPFREELMEIWDNVTPFRNYVRNNIQKIYMAVEEKAEKV